MSMFRVSPAELKSQADRLRDLNLKFREEVQKMNEREQALSKMWEGPARDEFHNAYQTDFEKFGVFYKGINDVVTRLVEAASDYSRAENTNVSTARTRKA